VQIDFTSQGTQAVLRHMEFVATGVAVGILLGSCDGRVLLLGLISILVTFIAAVCELSLGDGVLMSLSVAFCALFAVQAAYLSVAMALSLFKKGPAMRPFQAAIGEQLRAVLGVPGPLPPELNLLVARLDAA
jgi:hypothetical protein